ncbi:MAG: LAGLIDADG family homing endonuclease [Elusimicrobiales bacterium]
MTDVELGWLAGLIDGEGCITLTRAHQRDSIRPILQITNTSLPLLEKAQRLIEELSGKRPNIKIQSNRGKFGYRTCYIIQIRRHATIASVLRALTPHMVAKREQTELVLAFVESRMSAPRRVMRGRRGGYYKQWYSEVELELLERVHRLNSYSHRRERWGLHPTSSSRK